MMLTVSAWGETNTARLPWITPPPAGHLANAKDLLLMLGAIDKAGRLTKKGERLAQLPCHPRIANMLTEAGDMKAIACDIAAILEEKDPVADETDADISTRIAMLKHFRKDKIPSQWKKIDNISAQYMRLIRAQKYCENPEPEEIGKLVGFAYPERIAKREADGSYRLAQGGKLVSLHISDDLARHEYLAIASMGTRIFLAAPVDKDFVMSQGTWMECALWNSKEGKAIVREELRLGLLCLATRPLKADQSFLVAEVIASAAPKEGLTMFDFNDEVQGLQLRIAVTAGWHPELELPDVSTERVLTSAGEWLPMYIGNASTVQELRKIDMRNVILSF